MKRILLLTIVTLSFTALLAQPGNVGIGTTNPRPRALLHLEDNNKGLLVPRTDTTAVNAAGGLTNADKGLLIYNPTDNKFYYYTGTGWLSLPDNDWQILPGNQSQVSIPTNVGIGVPAPTANFHVSGTMRFQIAPSLADSIVLVMDANGNASTRVLPNSSWDGDNQNLSLVGNNLTISGGNTVALPFTNINAGLGLVASGPVGNQTIDVQANNGLNVDALADAVQLGGPLTENTTITNNNFNLDVNLNTPNAGRFQVQNNGNPLLHAENNNGGRIGIGTSTFTSPNALMEMYAQSKGVLIPEITTADMNAIPVVAPADLGLMVYNLDKNVHMYWNGTCWLPVGVTICTDFSIDCGVGSGCIYTSSASNVQFTMDVTLNSGQAVPVIIAAAGIPAGVTVNYSSTSVIPTDTVHVTITGSNGALPGTYPITFLAIFGPIVQQCTYTLTVSPGTLGITSSAGVVNEINVAPNVTTASTTININFPPNGPCVPPPNATLSATNVPAGVTASFTATNIPTVGGTSTLTFTANSCAVVGTYNISINLNLAGQIITFPYTLEVDTSVINVTANVANYNLYNAAATPNCPVTLICNIAAGVQVSSANIATPAFTTGNFPSGGTIILHLDCGALIAGKGGQGGVVDNNPGFPGCNNVNGKSGGPALSINTTGVIIDNSGACQGFIGGGGGGGGAGEDDTYVSASPCDLGGYIPGGGGGGGAGAGPGGVTPGGTSGCVSNGVNGNFAFPTLGGGVGGTNTACDVNCTFTINIWPFPAITLTTVTGAGNGGNGGDFGLPGNGGGGAYGSGNVLISGAINNISGCDQGSGGAPGYGILANGNTFFYVGQGGSLSAPNTYVPCVGCSNLNDPGVAPNSGTANNVNP